MAARMHSHRAHNAVENFFDHFFADPNLQEVGEDVDDILLQNLMLTGDRRDLDQAPNNRDFENDLHEGWSSEAIADSVDGGVVNMPFVHGSSLNVGEDFPQNPRPLYYSNMPEKSSNTCLKTYPFFFGFLSVNSPMALFYVLEMTPL